MSSTTRNQDLDEYGEMWFVPAKSFMTIEVFASDPPAHPLGFDLRSKHERQLEARRARYRRTKKGDR